MSNEEQIALNKDSYVSKVRNPQQHTIYAQYLRYRVSLENKKNALKFSDFCNLMYSQESMNTSSVEEVKGRHI